MYLSYLAVTDLRNIQSLTLEPGVRLNVITGRNGSGKTSLLEAIYLLARGRSFRSAYSRRIVRQGQGSLTVFGKIKRSLGGGETSIGVQIAEGRFKAKVSGRYLHKSSDLALLVPLLLITPDGDKLIKGSPRQRRRFLDWGLFHVEQSFLDVWQRYNRSLAQRNSLLRQKNMRLLASWDPQLIEIADKLDQIRQTYLEELSPIAITFLKQLADMEGVEIEYQRGWAEKDDLGTVLKANYDTDIKAGFTRSGPHRCDLVIRKDGRQAAEYFSGGQQKLAACALMLAQAALYFERTGTPCILLVDDLPAELDLHHRHAFLDLLYSLGGQAFVTTTDRDLLDLSGYPETKMFHVEQGQLT